MPAKTVKKPAPARSGDFAAVFAALRAILLPYVNPKMRVTADTSSSFLLETAFPVFRGKPVYFAGVKTGKGYVSFHLVPIYMHPALQKQISPELKKRMQGKACFNFRGVDEKLFAELSTLTAQGLEVFRKLAANPAIIEKRVSAAKKARKSKAGAGG